MKWEKNKILKFKPQNTGFSCKNINFFTNFAAIILLLFFCGLSYSCRKTYTPRPYGYYRVEIPKHEYQNLDTRRLPYQFDISLLTEIQSREKEGEKYWIDIVYPALNAKIHCSYKAVHSNLYELTEDARTFAYAHSGRADDINEFCFEHPEKSVYGILYNIKGNVASPVQFFTTDSIRRFFRGALYFENAPNKDSIAPMLDYIREDIIRLMETFEWKK